MKTLIGLGVIASVAMLGCALDADEPQASVGEQELGGISAIGGGGGGRHCPTEGCDPYNGAGIYTDEDGHASLFQNASAMVTRFYKNDLGSVVAQVRYDNTDGSHTVVEYGAARAWVDGQETVLTDMEETLTNIKLTFSNGVVLQGSQVMGVSIYIDMGYAVNDHRIERGVTLTFTAWGNEATMTHHTPVLNNEIIHNYYLRANPGMGWNSSTSFPYCHLRDGVTIDPVVFQQDIWVNASSMDVVQSPGTMTFSCRHGGIATVRWWGYSYRGANANLDLFASALAMKRASYCGNGDFYTVDGTAIRWFDQAGVNNFSVTAAAEEAQWGYDAATDRHRALCIKYANRRHTDMPAYGFPNFSGSCSDSGPIPPCPTTALMPNWLIVDQKGPTSP